MKRLNWKVFIIGFFAGLIGMMLSHGGVQLPENLRLFTNSSSFVEASK